MNDMSYAHIIIYSKISSQNVLSFSISLQYIISIIIVGAVQAKVAQSFSSIIR